MVDNQRKEELIEKMVANLSALRAKMDISQADLADLVGVGRQTLISIENRKSKMRWDTFLALMMVMSRNKETEELMNLLGLQLHDISTIIDENLLLRKHTRAIQDEF